MHSHTLTYEMPCQSKLFLKAELGAILANDTILSASFDLRWEVTLLLEARKYLLLARWE